ncbi:MAG: type II toxin-antitoxin system RelE/ParE family toxin [Ruminococcus sp.]|nr:type II toxin-antitoxin system RelE/ParE family toxin [Ruminococcus sp.]
MNWKVLYLPEAQKDLRNLDGSQRILVLKAIKKIQTNPLPFTEGGYGKPLGNKNGNDLSGFLKVKIKAAGLRIVYKIIRLENTMLIVVIGAREEMEVYETAQRRIEKNEL